jgi:peptidyl-prolyl cis-trans isomerase SurA
MRDRLRLALSGLVLAATALAVRPADALVIERIVAVVGDRPILLSDLRGRAKPFLIQIQQKVHSSAEQAAAESQVLKDLLQQMIDEELEQQSADRSGINVGQDEIDNAFKNIAAAQGLSVTELLQGARTKSGMSEQEYRDMIRRQILEGKMLQLRVKGRVRITDEDVKTMFDRTVREERKRRNYHPAWIVLQIMPGSSPEAIAERRALGKSLSDRARAGEDFAELAKKFSDDTNTRDKGGDLGIRTPQGSQEAATGQKPVMAPDLEAALMALEPGQVTGPMEVGGGRAIVVMKLLTRQPSRYTTLEAARGEMTQRLQQEIFEKAKRKWLDDLKKRTHLDVRL